MTKHGLSIWNLSNWKYGVPIHLHGEIEEKVLGYCSQGKGNAYGESPKVQF